MPRTIRCTGIRRGGSSTAITTATAICRFMCSAAITCWRRSCGRPTSTPRPERWTRTRIVLRADSGFAREALMAWCEENGVDYLFGLAKNQRLIRAIGAELAAAKEESETTGRPARRFKDLT